MLNVEYLEKIISQTSKEKLSCKVDKLGASSQRKTYSCEYNGVKYKIRKCFSENDAKDIERRILNVSHLSLFPTYFGKYNKWLLFEYLSFPEAKRDESEMFWHNLGYDIAKLETTASDNIDVGFGMEIPPILKKDLNIYLHECVNQLQQSGYLQHNQILKLHESFNYFLNQNPQSCYSYLDLLPGNILTDNEKIIFVDEEGLAGSFQGMSLIRAFDIWRSPSPPQGLTSNEKDQLFKGYQKGGANCEFFEKNELHLGIIYYLIKSSDSVQCSGTTNKSIKQLYSRLELL